MEHEVAYETRAEPIELHLHELAEGLQAARNYLEALRHQVSQAGGTRMVEADVLEKIAQQFDRAQKGFRRLRDQLDGHPK